MIKEVPKWWDYKYNLYMRIWNGDYFDNTIKNIEDVKDYCKSEVIWPYYYQKENCYDADLILVPYNILFNEDLRENYEINLSNAIVVVDEGHNAPQVWESLASVEITGTKLMLINSELKDAKKFLKLNEMMKFQNQDLIRLIEKLQTIVSSFSYFLKSIKFPIQETSLSSYKNLFEIYDNFLIAKAKNLFTVIKMASSWRSKQNEFDIDYEDSDEEEKKSDYDMSIDENNLKDWLAIIENIISWIAQNFKHKTVIHTEEFHKVIKTLELLSKMQGIISNDESDKITGEIYTYFN